MEGTDKYVGRILDNRYEILELIGTGGMALVYKARCHRLNRMVAIKILKEDLAGDEEFQRRFYTESQAVAMLSHPNIVAVYDVSRSGNTEYIVMELIEGITLKQYINRKGLLNWKEALHFATQITKALCHAHSRGIIHRDIKPHNIMILKDGSVKVADFGIARLLSVQNTLTQEALGSVHYISPEQAKGGHVDARSDIYSVGVVMYEMLTSRLPFVGESAVSVAIQHISAIPLMPRDINPDIPIGLEDITMHAMEPDLNLRFTTAEEMLNDLEDFRKNPAILFNYAISDQQSRESSEMGNLQDMRGVPRGNVARPHEPPVRVDRPVQPVKRQIPAKPEMNSDEYRETKKRANSTTMLVGIFVVIAFLIVLLVLIWPFISSIFSPEDSEPIIIPRFINRNIDLILEDDEYRELFSFEVTYEVSDEYPEGVVIRQKPEPERELKQSLSGKTRVELVVSLGVEEFIMPNLIGKDWTDARNELNNLRLDLEIIEEAVASEVEKGLVIETRPAAAAKIARGNTVRIIRSAGPDMVEVPNLVGRTKDVVISVFGDLGLNPVFRETPDASEAGTVLFIADVGTLVQPGRSINVTVSSGPQTPTTTEAPTPDTPSPTTPEPPSPTTPDPTITSPDTPPSTDPSD